MTGKRERSQEQYDLADEAFVYLYSRLPFLIQRACQISTAMFSTQSGGDVTLPQFQLLDLLAQTGASPQIDLARRAGIDAATAGLILANLLRSGRVQRRVDSNDTRRKIVAITDKGRRALTAAAENNRAVDRMIGEWLGADAALLGQLLDRLAGNAAADAVPSRRTDKLIAAHVALELALKLRRCLQVSERQLADAVGPLGLTMRQFAVLYLMPIMPGVTQSDVVRLLGYETSNAALVLRILQGKTLIEAFDGGARRRRYRITAVGEELLVSSHSLVIAAEQSLSRGLADADTGHLQRLLGSILQRFDCDMRQPMPTFVAVQSQSGWPMPSAPGPSFLVRRRAARSRKPKAAHSRQGRHTSTDV